MFSRKFRLRHRKDIDFVMKRGRKLPCRHFIVWFLPGSEHNFRVTVIVGKKVEKSAVKRNLVSRRLREAIRRTIQDKFPAFPDLDMIFWVKHENTAETFDYHEIQKEVELTLSHLENLASEPSFNQIKNRRR